MIICGKNVYFFTYSLKKYTFFYQERQTDEKLAKTMKKKSSQQNIKRGKMALY